MHLFYSNILIFYALLIFQTRGSIFMKTIVYTGMV